ncbi:MAG: CAP domain-containing protein, partial [Myxococcota bacterium]|nr:CAP domain-containing protein [Myxococcota bacterium]
NIPPMVSSSLETPHPIEAEKLLYRSVNALRKQRGLRQLSRFSTFEPLAREHSAWMAAAGVVAHSLPGTTNGVAKQAGQRYHPRARHYENVAAAYSATEALEMVVNSPGHLKALLCDTCTHMSIGAAIEPTLKTQPRLFVTWELLAFPQGVPKKIERFNKDETTP